jgi:L-fucose mutarotase/ribose pyranase (RbsD/FucU family)
MNPNVKKAFITKTDITNIMDLYMIHMIHPDATVFRKLIDNESINEKITAYEVKLKKENIKEFKFGTRTNRLAFYSNDKKSHMIGLFEQ